EEAGIRPCSVTGIQKCALPNTVNLTGISSGASNQVQTLTVNATSSNPGLVPNPTVNYTSPNSTGTLSFTPAAFATGSTTIAVTEIRRGPRSTPLTPPSTIPAHP